jgi:hypothetical protein
VPPRQSPILVSPPFSFLAALREAPQRPPSRRLTATAAAAVEAAPPRLRARISIASRRALNLPVYLGARQRERQRRDRRRRRGVRLSPSTHGQAAHDDGSTKGAFTLAFRDLTLRDRRRREGRQPEASSDAARQKSLVAEDLGESRKSDLSTTTATSLHRGSRSPRLAAASKLIGLSIPRRAIRSAERLQVPADDQQMFRAQLQGPKVRRGLKTEKRSGVLVAIPARKAPSATIPCVAQKDQRRVLQRASKEEREREKAARSVS